MKNFLKSFFCEKGKPQPVYFWITVFNLTVLITLWLRIAGSVEKYIRTGIIDFSDTLVISILGFIQVWVGFYNWRKNNKDEKNKE